MTDLLDSLNPQQKKAVTLPETSALVLAGAGSGKTSVLIARIAYLLEHNMANPAEIFAVTFTNKAANEMKTRLTARMTLNTRAMWVGTFHGLCNRLLRYHAQAAGLPETFAILDTSDQLSAVKRIMKANNISEELVNAKKVQNYISRQKENGLRAADIKPGTAQEYDMHRVYGLYEQALNREGAVDFGELILRTYELLMRNEPLRRQYQDRFRFILVDEFQDTNKLQYKFLKLLAGHGEPGRDATNAVFAVGDDDQSIYAFRGAYVGNMQDFIREFKIGEPIRLEQNYRSQSNILDAANYLISNNRDRLGKNLWTESGKGEPIYIYEAQSEDLEAAYVVDCIKELARDGEDLREIAILYRSNAQSRALETELSRRGVKYLVYGGLRFFDRAEIKNALAYMRLAENIKDDSAFLRIVNVPARGIGAKTIENLIEIAKNHNCSLLEAIPTLQGAMANKLMGFAQIISDIREKRDSVHLPDLVNYVVSRSGLQEMYEKDENGSERIENLKELTSSAKAFLMSEGIKNDLEDEVVSDTMTPLAQFLSQATLEAGDNQARAGEEAVQLMTIHASKGLEFNNVFITGLEEGLFPNDMCRTPKELQEERRLMYVAITRARKNLYVTYADYRLMHGMPRYNVASQFIRELPENCVKYLTPKNDIDDDGYDSRRGGYRNNSFGYNKSSWSDYSGRDSSREGWGEKPKTRYENTPDWAKGIKLTKEEKIQEKNIRKKAGDNDGFNIGIRLSHSKFGPGTIIDTQRNGEDKIIVVKFDSAGVKNLLLKIARAKLTIL